MTEPDRIFIIIPPHIRALKDITPIEKMVFGAINGLTQKEGYCYASNSWLADIIGITEDRVSKHISKLAKKGYLSLEIKKIKRDERTGLAGEKYGTIRHIYIYNIPKMEYGIDENVEPPIDENVEYKGKNKKKERGTSALGGLPPRSAPPSSEKVLSYKKLTITNQLRVLAGALCISRNDFSDGSLLALYNRIKKTVGRENVIKTAFDWLVVDIRNGKLPAFDLYRDYGEAGVADRLPKTFSEVEEKMNKLLEITKKDRPERYAELTAKAQTKKYDF